MCVSRDPLALPKWQFGYPIGVDLMRRIEVGNRSQSCWVPGIDYLAVATTRDAAFRRDSIRVRRDVDGSGVGVVEPKLHPMRHVMLHINLHGVV